MLVLAISIVTVEQNI